MIIGSRTFADLPLDKLTGGVVQVTLGVGAMQRQLRGEITGASLKGNNLILTWDTVDVSQGGGDWRPFTHTQEICPEVVIRGDQPLLVDDTWCYTQALPGFRQYIVFAWGENAEDRVDAFVWPN